MEEPFSQDPFSFEAALEGRVLALPCPASRLTGAGWVSAVSADEPFLPGQYATVVYTKGAAAVTAVLANRGQAEAALRSCDIIGLSAESRGGAALELAGGISFGLAPAQVAAVCGVPDEGQAAVEGAKVLTYTAGRYTRLRFTFTDGALTGMETLNRSERAAPPDPAALPGAVQAYIPPTGLEADWQCGTVQYGGTLYTLPAPVSEFLAAGWVLPDDATLPANGWLLGVRLQKGNQTLRTRVQNFSGEAAGLSGCFVTMVESSLTGANLPLTLSGGISESSTQSEVLALLGSPHSVYQISTAVTCTYFGDGMRLDCTFLPGDGSMRTLKLSAVRQPDL